MKDRSDTYKIIDSIVPPILVPKCGNGYHHVSNLSMGQKFPGELGQRSWFCRGPQAVRCKGEIKPMDCQTWKEVKEAIAGLDKKAGPIDTEDAETYSVTVFVFITKNDDPIQFERKLDLGSYAPHADREFCELTGFPHTPFAIYDSFFGDFLRIPTWSRYDIRGETPVIIRPLGFEDEDCGGLEGLLTQLEDQTYDKKMSLSSKGKEKTVFNSRSAGRKRKRVDYGEGGSDLKRRKYEVIIELTGGESKEVLVIDDSD